MFKHSVRATLACTALALASTPAFAWNDTPVTGATVGVEQNPAASTPVRAVTDAKGKATFAKLGPGRYVVFFPELPERKDPFRVSVSSSGTGSFSCLLVKWPGAGHRVDLVGKDKQKLSFDIGRSGGQLQVSVATIPTPPKGKSLGAYTPCDGPAK